MIPGYIMHEMRSYESRAAAAGPAVRDARTIMDLVRAVNNRPRAQSMLRCLANVKDSDNRLMMLAGRRADQLVSQRLEVLESQLGTEEFCVEAGNFRQELRCLLPAVGRVAKNAERLLNLMERSMQDGEPVARERSGG